jgi:hypothetical protein
MSGAWTGMPCAARWWWGHIGALICRSAHREANGTMR